MALLRGLIERLLALGFGMVTAATSFAGFSMLLAAAVGFVFPGRAGAPAWVSASLAALAGIGAILVVGGVVQGRLGSRLARSVPVLAPGSRLGWTRVVLIPTLALPAAALFFSGPLFELWRELLLGIDRSGARAALARGADPFAGLVLFPVVAVLFVPALQLLAALFLIVVPPFLLLLRLARSPRFGAHGALTLAAQVTFVAVAFAGAHLFVRLAEVLLGYVRAAGGQEAVTWPPIIQRLSDGVMSTAWRQLAGMGASALSWGALRLLEREEHQAIATPIDAADPEAEPTAEWSAARPGPWSSAEAQAESHTLDVDLPVPKPTETEPAAAPPGPAYASVSDLPEPSRRALEVELARYRSRVAGEVHVALPARPESGAPRPHVGGGSQAGAILDRIPVRAIAHGMLIARVLLVGWGALMLFSGACLMLQPRAHFVESSPSAGGSVPRPPASVVVRFDRALDPGSSIAVRRALALDGTADVRGDDAQRASRLDSSDPAHRTLEAELGPLSAGVYRVEWQAFSTSGGAPRSGAFYFGVGRGVPGELAATPGRPYQERDAGARGHRAALLAGVVLLVVAALVPKTARRA